jgi:hypothetical protein
MSKELVERDTNLHQWTDDELMADIDGSDVERVVDELIARGGRDAQLGIMLWRVVLNYYLVIDPGSSV